MLKKTIKINILTAAALIILTALSYSQARENYNNYGDECTIMGAAGYSCKGGGTIVLKNRDRNIRFNQQFCYEKPDTGYAFIGVKNIGGPKLAYTMGINEKGLICVNSSSPKKVNFDYGKANVYMYQAGQVLNKVSTVDEFIEKILKAGAAKGPGNYIVADGKKMCLAEVIDGTHFDYKIIINGFCAHTNHYYFDSMKKYQPLPLNASSEMRLDRACELGHSGIKPITVEKFMAFSRDHGKNETPSDKTICRHPDMFYDSKKFDGGTISSMIFTMKPGAKPCAYLCLGQPCTGEFVKFEFETDGTLTFNGIFDEFLKDGSYNNFKNFERDFYWHIIMPFFYKNPLLKSKDYNFSESET